MEGKPMFRSIHWQRDAGQREVLLDRRGHPRPAVTLPGYRAGEHPPNYGLTLPAEILTVAEVGRLMDACARRGPGGIRNRALIVLLWRGGLRSAEALALELRDVDRDAGTLTIRHGKGNRRRVVGLDPPAFAVLEQWLAVRSSLGVPRGAPVFCTITAGNRGRPLSASYWRQAITKLGVKAGIEKRVHSHGLRHTHAVELMREGVPLLVISRQLGHSSLSITQRYVDHLEPGEVVATMQARRWDSRPDRSVPRPSA
jgi:site-specific recombinase XerD